MLIELGNESKLIDSATPGYNSCGCGNRRYYTKAEIDEMLAGLMDEDKIKEIIDQLFLDYVEENDFVEIILNAIGDIYTQDQIDALLSELESRIKTWVEAKGYLTDISLTINGQTLHNGDSIYIQGGGGDPIDISGKLDVTAFTQFENEMRTCCNNVNSDLQELLNRINNLQEQIDNITGGTTPDTGDTPTPSTTKYMFVTYNVTSTTEPTRILYTTEKVSSIENTNGGYVAISQYYTFPATGEQTLKFIYTGNTLYTGGKQWYGLGQIVNATANNIAPGQYAFAGTSIRTATLRNADWYVFANCKQLTNINYGSGFGRPNTSVFSGCSALNQDFVIADGVEQIRSSAFKDSGIKSITFPTSLKEVWNNALAGCSNLQYIRFKGTTPPALWETNPLGSTSYAFPIYVPNGYVNVYKQQFGDYASRIQVWNG